MKKALAILILLFLCKLVNGTGTYIFVDAGRPDDSGNGLSWTTAKKTLQAALNIAVSGDNIWVKKGTYYPTSAYDLTNTSRYYHFRMKNNVGIYGGFAGTEPTTFNLANRDLVTNETILSGDIGTVGVRTDNCYHVFYHPDGLGLDSTAILNGFTISYGQSNGSAANLRGGGMLNYTGNAPRIEQCNFSNNLASLGGGMYNAGAGASPKITNCKFFSNSVIINGSETGFGGGIYITTKAGSTIINCLIYNNTAEATGGGIYVYSSSAANSASVIITNTTIANNSADFCGGIRLWDYSIATLNNCILWGNTHSSTTGRQIAISDNSSATLNYTCYSNATNDMRADGSLTTANCITSDPQFINTAAGNFRLIGNTPCINSGYNNYNNESKDLRGKDRIQYTTIDMGPYEWTNAIDAGSIIYVDYSKTSGSNIGTNWANAYTSLQTAISASSSGDQIWVAKGTYYPSSSYDLVNTPRNYHFRLKNNVRIYGGFAGIETTIDQRNNYGNGQSNETILSGDLSNNDDFQYSFGYVSPTGNDNCYHLFYHPNGTALTSAAVLDGFTIKGGNSNSTAPNNAGGGMFNYSSSPTLNHIVFVHNSAYLGSGMYNYSSSPVLNNVTFNNNIGPYNSGDLYGGGVYNENSSSPTITNAVFSSNFAMSGAGLCNKTSSSPKLFNVLFYDNNAVAEGGAILNVDNSSPIITNATISANDASFGGGICNINLSSPTLNNCIITGNTTSDEGHQMCIYNGTTLANNTCYSNGTNDIYVGTGTFTPTFCITSNPRFIDATNNIFRIAGTSPCVNTGKDSYNTTTTDVRGQARKNGGIDIGAYEWTGGIDSAGIIIYVNASRTSGNNDGLSWINAYTSLQTAIESSKKGDKIWVAKGTYYPSSTNKICGFDGQPQCQEGNKHFEMKNGVAIYGGFAGTEPENFDLSLRDFITNETVLNGTRTNGTYSYHVIYNPGTITIGSYPVDLTLSNSTILDGFTITGGHADGSAGAPGGGNGGGIFTSGSSETYRNLKITGNSARTGGGINGEYSNFTLTNSVIFNNASTSSIGSGGGIYLWSTSAVLNNVTIANNTAANVSGGIYASYLHFVINNCIIWGNTSVTGKDLGLSTSATATINNSCYSSTDSIRITPINCISKNPKFINAANKDYRIGTNSPCIDAGNNSYCTLTKDIRGGAYDRKLLKTNAAQTGPIDMGAYEYKAGIDPYRSNDVIYVNQNQPDDNGVGLSWATAKKTLQAALDMSFAGDSIFVAKGIYKPTYANGSTNLRKQNFQMKDSVAIFGGFVGSESASAISIANRDFITNKTILSGDLNDNDIFDINNGGYQGNSGDDNCYHVFNNVNVTLSPKAILDGFTITGGNANGGDISSNYGGGMYNYSSIINSTLNNLIFTANSARSGGGLQNEYSHPTLNNVLFYSNFAGWSGGGICNVSISTGIIFNNITLVKNYATEGGGLSNYASYTTLNNSIVWNNNATTTKQLLCSGGCPITLNYSCFSNEANDIGSYITTTNNNITTNPQFVDAPNNDFRLTGVSPCLDAGNNIYNNQTTDIRGTTYGRKLLKTNAAQAGTIDMGAYEYKAAADPARPQYYIYVNTIRPDDNGDGLSWATAKKTLQAAIDMSGAGDYIWVAKGTYYPSSAYDLTNTARYYHFRMKNNVSIYGGFAGIENPLTFNYADRDYSANETILSGDIGTPNNNTDNCYHIFYHPLSTALTASAILDGFTIKDGNANGTSPHNKGAGMYNASAALTLRNIIFSNNTAVTDGGGLYNLSSSVNLLNTSFSLNTASNNGGAVYNTSSAPTLINILIKSNVALNAGGGIYNDQSSTRLTNVTLSKNSATSGGGIYNANNSSPILNNCILWDNTASSNGHELYINGGTTTLNYSCYANQLNDIYNNAGTFTTVNHNITSDPLFANTASGDFRIYSNSPCVDAGNNSYNATSSDIRGKTRIQNSLIDMGAYEWTFAVDPDNITLYYVDYTKTAGHNTGKSWTDAYTSLQTALFAAVSGDTIWVAKGTYKPSYDYGLNIISPYTARGYHFRMKDGVGIYGGFAGTESNINQRANFGYGEANETVLSGDLNGNDVFVVSSGGFQGTSGEENCFHVFYHPKNMVLSNTAILDGFTVKGANSNDTYVHDYGGGMFNDSVSPTINNVTFTSCYAVYGGGLYNKSANPILNNVTFLSNRSNNGGGIYNTGSSPILTNVKFISNSRCGFFNINGSATILNNCVFNSNSTEFLGGAINCYQSSLVINNATFSQNSANNGGAVTFAYSTGSLNNCIIWGNSAYNQGSQLYLTSSNITLNYSCYSTASNDLALDSYSTIATTNHNITTNPKFVDLWGNDFRLMGSSPCINTGLNSYNTQPYDIRGQVRIQNTTIDMGAYEWTSEVDPPNDCVNPTNGGTIAGDQTICFYTLAQPITSSTLPTGYIGTIEYKWQSSTTSSTEGFADIMSSGNTPDFTPGDAVQTKWFRRLARVNCATDWTGAASSNVVQITMRPYFTAGSISYIGATVCYNGDPGVIASETPASGGDGSISYQWQYSTDAGGVTLQDIPGATSETYDPPAGLTENRWYRRMAKDGLCKPTFQYSSSVWAVSVRSDFTAGAISTTGATVCYNGNPDVIGSLAVASGGNGSITYQWQYSNDAAWTSPQTIASSNSATYDPPSGLTANRWYRRQAKDGSCSTTFTSSSGVWAVTILPSFTAGAILTTGATICYNGDPDVIGSATDASGGDATVTYQWQYSTTSTWSLPQTIAGSNSATYDPPAGLTANRWYRRQAKDGACNASFITSTGVWAVTVRPSFSAGNIGTSGATICYNGDPGIITTSLSASGGDGSITYQWQYSTDAAWTSPQTIAGSNSNMYDPPAGLTENRWYRRQAKDGTCNTTFTSASGVWMVTVRPQFTPGAILTTGDVVCYNGDPIIIYSSSLASGGNGSLTYQWQYSSDSLWTSPQTIASSNLEYYNPPAGLTANRWYRRQAKDGVCNTTFTSSAGIWAVKVRPMFTPGAILTTGDTIVNNGDPDPIGSATIASGGDASISYQWQYSTSATWSSPQTIAGSNSATYDPPAGLTANRWYRRQAKDATCNTTFSNSSGVWLVMVAPTASVTSSAGCGTGTVNVSSDLSGAQTFDLCDNAGSVLQTWTGSASSHDFSGLTAGDYKGRVTKSGCASALSATTTLTNGSAPTATVSSIAGCGTGTVTITSDLNGTQTFDLCDNAGSILQTWTGSASSHDFTGLADGIYKGQVSQETCASALSSATTLTNSSTLNASVSNIPGCSEGTVTVSSDLSGPQTFDLCDNTGSILQTWTGNATSHAFTGIVDGTYKGKVTLGSCVSELSLATTLSNSLIPLASVSNLSGCGTGTITVSSDQSGTQTFDLCDNAGLVLQTWTGSATSHDFSGLADGTYKGKVTIGSCSSALSAATILFNNATPIASLASTEGCGTGSITLNSDQNGIQTFDLCDNAGTLLQTWTGNATSYAFTGLADGTYKGKVTMGSCISGLSLPTTLINSIIPVASISNTVGCGNGTITVSSNQSGSQTFDLCDNAGSVLQTWTGSATSHDFNGLIDGTYKGKVTLGSCTSALSSITMLTNNSIPIASVSNSAGCETGTVTVSSDQSGTQTFDLCDNAGLVLQTWTGSAISHNFIGLTDGTYKGKVTMGSCASALSTATTLTNNPAPIAFISNTAGCGTGIITVSSDQSGTQTFDLCDNAGLVLQTWTGNATSYDFSGLADGTYKGKVTMGGCVSIVSTASTLINNIVPTAAVSNAAGCGTGIITVSSDQSSTQTFDLCDNTGTVLQSWTGNAISHNFSGLSDGTYKGKVTMGSCVSVLSAATTLINSSIPISSVSNTAGCGAGTGTVTISSNLSGMQIFDLCDNSGSVLQSWIGIATSHDFPSLADGTYKGKVTMGSCVSVLSSATTLTNKTVPIPSITTIAGCGEGTINVSSDKSGIQTFDLCNNAGSVIQTWTGNATSHDFTGLVDGTYKGKVTYGSCASAITSSSILTNNTIPTATIASTVGCGTGIITVHSNQSGTQTFVLCDNAGMALQTWTGNATSHDFISLIDGVYKGKIILNSCISDLSFAITLTNSIVPLASASTIAGCGTGTITVISDQSAIQTFDLCDNAGLVLQTWTGNATSHPFTALLNGTYKVKVTLGTCASDLSLITLTNNDVPLATASSSAGCGTGAVTISSDQSGIQNFELCDNAGLMIQFWTGDAVSHTFNGLANGIYKGKVTKGSCVSDLSAATTLNNGSAPIVSVTSIAGCGTGSVTISSSQSGTQTFELCDNAGSVLQIWTGNASSHAFTGLSDGSYKGKVTAGSCVPDLSAATTLTNGSAPTASVSVAAGCGQGNITISSSQTDIQTFELCDDAGMVLQAWTGNAASHVFTGLADGTYKGKVTLGSCISDLSSASVLTNNIAPIASVQNTAGCGTGTVTVISDQSGLQTFDLCDNGGTVLQTWTTNATSYTFAGLTDGTYKGKVTLGICVSEISAATSLTNSLIPLVSISNAAGCVTGTVTINSNLNDMQTFELCDNSGTVLQSWISDATSHTFTGLADGTYKGKVTLGSCISDLSTATTLVNGSAPIAFASSAAGCGIGTVTIVSSQSGTQTFDLCDNSGTVLQSWTGDAMLFAFTGLSDGIYKGKVTMGSCVSDLSTPIFLANNATPIAMVYSTPECGTGKITIISSQSGTQTFELCDISGIVIQSWTGDATSHTFISLADGTYKGKVTSGSCVSSVSSATTLTNTVVPVATVWNTPSCGLGSVTVVSDQSDTQTFELCDNAGSVLQFWNGNATSHTFTSLSDGIYKGKVTLGSCVSAVSSSTTLTNSIAPIAMATSAAGCGTGTVTVVSSQSGTQTFELCDNGGLMLQSWTGDASSHAFTGIADGFYKARVTLGSCVSELSTTTILANNTAPIAMATSAAGCGTGTVTVVSSQSGTQTFELCDNGGLMLQSWTGDASSHAFTGIADGFYKARVTLGSCVSELSTTTILANNTAPIAMATSAAGCGTGTVTVVSSQSGTQTFELCDNGGLMLQSWTGDASSHAFTGIADGFYKARVTLGSCVSELSTTTILANNTAPIAMATSAAGCGTGSVTIVSSQSGTQTFELCDNGGLMLQSWTGDASSHAFTGIADGFYKARVTLGGCVSELSTTTILANNITPIAMATSAAGCGTGTVTITSNQSGMQTFELCDNTGSMLQIWTGSATSHDFTGLADGTYKGKVTFGSCLSDVSLATVLINNSAIPVSVIISANPGTSVSEGESITFTAAPTNGGTPSYQWQVNGVNVGTDLSTYSSDTLNDGDDVTCIMTSSLACTLDNPATSNTLTIEIITTGIESNLDNLISIYAYNTSIYVYTPLSNSLVEVYDMLGNLLYSLNSKPGMNIVNRNFATGIYMVKVQTNGTVKIEKVLLNK